jgi:hypothetical protein
MEDRDETENQYCCPSCGEPLEEGSLEEGSVEDDSDEEKCS